jgi:TonB family protein
MAALTRLRRAIAAMTARRLAGSAPAAMACAAVLATAAAAAAAEDLAAFDDRFEGGISQACKSPMRIAGLPDGRVAGKDDMVEAMQAVRQLDAQTTAYADCVRKRMAERSADAAATAAQKAAVERIGGGLINDAIDAAENVATRFNEELREFKARPQDAAGSRYVPARMKADPKLEDCVPPALQLQGTFRLRVTVGVDGRASVEEILPLEVAPRLFSLAACAAEKLQYTPATRDGKPEPAEVWIPVTLAAYAGQTRDAVTTPVLVSTTAQFLAATDECYPADLRAAGPEGQVKLKLALSPSGIVRSPTVAEGSGNAAVDATARCIARRLRFTPATAEGEPQEVEIVWTVPVKPPAAWLKPAAATPAN